MELSLAPRLSGIRIKTLLSRELGMSESLIKSLKNHENAVLLNGAPIFITERAQAGDLLRLTIPDEEACTVLGSEGELKIAYEDEDVLVVNKPAPLPCHPDAGHKSETLSNYLVRYYERLGQRFIPRIITRLDSGTSGLVLLAKNPLAACVLGTAAKGGGLKKEYLAVALGAPPCEKGEICAPLRRSADSAIKREVCQSGQGQRAKTLYELISSAGGLSLLRVFPETGRTHQIRVHMAALGCPLAGDFLYGGENEGLISRPALHMAALGFEHPITKAPIFLRAAPPEDMKAIFPTTNEFTFEYK